MQQLSIKSFWGAARPKATEKAEAKEEEHEEDATAAIDAPAKKPSASHAEPTPKRARLTSAKAAPAPARRSSPRNQKKTNDSPAAGAAADEEKEENDSPPRRRGGASKTNKKNAAKDQKPQQRKAPAAAKKKKKAETSSGSDEDDEDDDGNGSGDKGEADAAPTTAAERGADGLTDYERQRAEQIARNRARLAALELPAMAANLAASVAAAKPRGGAGGDKAAGPSQRGATAAKRRAREAAAAAGSPPAPRRQSSRVRGLAAEAVGPLPEDRFINALQKKNIYGFVDAPQEARFDPAPVPLCSAANTGGGSADASFLRALAARLGGGGTAGGRSPSPSFSSPRATLAALARLRLSDDEDVAKVCPLGITGCALHPGELARGRLLLAAADKKGIVALWDVEHGRRGRAGGAGGVAAAAMEVDDDDNGEAAGGAENKGRAVRSGGGGGASGSGSGSEEGDGGGDDGVFQYAAHSQYVCGLRWVGHGAGAKLLSASFDGSVRLLDLSRAAGPAASAAAAASRGGGDASAASAAAAPSSAGFELLQGIPDEAAGLEWSAVEAGGADGAVVFLATADGEMTAVDTRGGKGAPCLPLVAAHDKRVHSLSLEPGGGTLLASICTDGVLKVFDLRKVVDGRGRAAPCEQQQAAGAAGAAAENAQQQQQEWLPPAPLGEGRHGRSSHAAYWAPDGSRRLLSVSFDDTLAVWRYGGGDGEGGAGAEEPPPAVVAGARVVSKKGKKPAPEGDGGSGLLRRALTLRHNNDTGRYVVPFKPFWAPGADGFFVGEMDPTPHHGMGLYDASSGGKMAFLGREGLLTAIPARGCAGELPGGAGVMVACTSSGRAHVFR